jgi:hypothetical protein
MEIPRNLGMTSLNLMALRVGERDYYESIVISGNAEKGFKFLLPNNYVERDA